jgi:hypothetical protein
MSVLEKAHVEIRNAGSLELIPAGTVINLTGHKSLNGEDTRLRYAPALTDFLILTRRLKRSER